MIIAQVLIWHFKKYMYLWHNFWHCCWGKNSNEKKKNNNGWHFLRSTFMPSIGWGKLSVFLWYLRRHSCHLLAVEQCLTELKQLSDCVGSFFATGPRRKNKVVFHNSKQFIENYPCSCFHRKAVLLLREQCLSTSKQGSVIFLLSWLCALWFKDRNNFN